MAKYSIADAKNGLPQLIREAEAGYDISVTRRGEPVAVIIGTQRYSELTDQRASFGQVYQRFREENDLAELDIDPGEVFGGVRDRSPGRDFSW